MKSTRNGTKQTANKTDNRIIVVVIIIGLFLFTWMLCVIKVTMIDTNTSINVPKTFPNMKKVLFPKPIIRKLDEPENASQAKDETQFHIPPAQDWDFKKFKSIKSSSKNLKPGEVTLAHELSWPPVTATGEIPPSDGYDIMPLTEIQVPRFWEAPPGIELENTGSKIGGHETIFLMIASYRDFQCHETINSAFSMSDHPERLFVGAVDQVVPGDVRCGDTDVPCAENPNQPICKYKDQISVFTMDASMATGPVTARHIGDRMYRGQYYVMQMDAHCQFVLHWDTFIIQQWKMTGNEMAVLSSYLSDVQGSIDKNYHSTRDTRPIMCNSDFEGVMPARYLRHGSQPEDVAAIRDMPQLQPFWAAGFSFSRGHFKMRVPYDGIQPMVFQVLYYILHIVV
jgi:hypothetical protein